MHSTKNNIIKNEKQISVDGKLVTMTNSLNPIDTNVIRLCIVLKVPTQMV